MIRLYGQNANAKNITFVNKLSTEATAFADSNMIEIVFRNLLNNAVKYSNLDGEIIVSSNKTDGYICIGIKDSGVGMSEETLHALFKEGTIDSQNGTKGERGTGLGLVLCKEFVEKNGGRIEVSSELYKGSEFTVFLPLSE